MANVNYYLGPYVWADDKWNRPATTVGSIDLRNLTHMGTAVTPNGVGFFATTGTLGVGYDLLGQGDLRDLTSTGAMKTTWLGVLGYTPKGPKLVNLLYDHLVFGSDPTGADDCKPLLPDGKNALSVHLGGHSRVFTKSFRVGHSPESNRVVAVLQEDYKKIRLATIAGDYPADTHRKVLGYWARQFKVKRPQDVFIPGGVPKEDPLPPSSTFSENFNGADNAAVGKQLTWVEGEDTTTWENRDSQARRPNSEDLSPSIKNTARCTSALSSANQEAQVTFVTTGSAGNKNARGGVTLRYSSSADTCYGFLALQTSGAGDGPLTSINIEKIVAGVQSSVDIVAASDSIPLTLVGRVIGSSLTLLIGGVEALTGTDTAITGNLFGGMWGMNRFSGTDIALDDWSITDDFPASDSGAPMMMGLL